MLSRVPYPLEKGDKLRAFHMIRELSKQHEIHLFCIAEERTDAIAQEKLKAYCKEVYVYRISRFKKWVGLLRSLFSGKPFQVEYFYAASAQKKLDSGACLLQIYTSFIYHGPLWPSRLASRIPLANNLL